MKEINNLAIDATPKFEGTDRGISKRPASGRSARIWPAVSLVFWLAGCGGATAPCPTPTTELDRLRAESEQAERDLDQATQADRDLRARRDEASRRIAAAHAALDSLGTGGGGR